MLGMLGLLNGVLVSNEFWKRLKFAEGIPPFTNGLMGISCEGRFGVISTTFEFGRSNAFPETDTNCGAGGGSGGAKN